MDKININCHSSIQIGDMFFDPFKTKNLTDKAKYVFITHTHYDHLSVSDIENIIDDNSVIFATHDAEKELSSFSNKIVYVEPNEKFNFDDLIIETFPSYNTNKDFHKKDFGWVGFKITHGGISYVVVGDTDVTEELEQINCDVLFLPVGGTYTMTATEAATLANKISPKIAIPTHYGSIVGTKHDGEVFKQLLNENIECKLLIQ